jgi:hypothetical protein
MIMGASINVYDEDGDVINDGHSVNVVGYTTYRENSTGNMLKFLTVGDGWYDYPRYFLYDTSKLKSWYIVYVE